MSWVTVKVPWAPEPLACMLRSGITSRAKWASFSSSQTSCNRAGPRGPAVWMLKLSVTGVPDAWARGGRLDWSFIDLLLSVGGWPRIGPVLRDIEIPATQPALRQRYSCLRNRRLLTELRLRKTGRQRKCMPPLGNDFGSIAVIAAVLRQSPDAGSYSAAAAQCFSASPGLAHTSARASARASASASWQGLGVIRSRSFGAVRQDN